MRELKVVGLDADGKNIICQGAIPSEQFKLPVDDRLRAALRDDSVQPEQAQLDIEVTNVLSPKEIQARIRAGASVEQVAAASGSDIARIRRFAHPVLLERSRAAELQPRRRPAPAPTHHHARQPNQTSPPRQPLHHPPPPRRPPPELLLPSPRVPPRQRPRRRRRLGPSPARRRWPHFRHPRLSRASTAGRRHDDTTASAGGRNAPVADSAQR